ncbi:HAMP domain-containing sensor histidine kinase [Streptomyces sp. NPDC005811]|uniref:sensor histidine kinase n=1 Tax=Streptomyces sp. NPDC005811 TaxID=3154565 RepID=UPI0033CF907D
MTWRRARALVRRLRPATIRMRMALLATVITLVPLTAASVPVALMVRSSLMESAGRKVNLVLTDVQSRVNATKDLPDCTRSFQRVQLIDDKYISLCRPTRQAGPSVGKLSLLPWTNPVRGPIPIRAVISRTNATPPESVAVTQSLDVEQARLNTVVRLLIGGVAGITLLVSGATWLAAGRALRPVEAIRADFADLSAHHLDRRVPVPRTGTEIARLAVTMNATLDRLQKAVDQQRQFTADASHELRTPLACLRTELELALNAPAADWPRAVRDAHRDTVRLQDLTENLLLLARLDSPQDDQVSRRTVDLTDLVREETARRHPPQGVVLEVCSMPGPITVRGHHALLARVLGNLLDNAERHATGTITVGLGHDDALDQAVLDVRDDGPGIPREEGRRIFERFTRLDDARARDTGGTGLGLAIAERIALTHGGTVTLTPSTGGAHFTLRLPTKTRTGDTMRWS